MPKWPGETEPAFPRLTPPGEGLSGTICEMPSRVWPERRAFRGPAAPTQKSSATPRPCGWGAWIRTREWRYQKPLPYRLATPHQAPDLLGSWPRPKEREKGPCAGAVWGFRSSGRRYERQGAGAQGTDLRRGRQMAPPIRARPYRRSGPPPSARDGPSVAEIRLRTVKLPQQPRPFQQPVFA